MTEEAPDVIMSLKTPFRGLAAKNLPLSAAVGPRAVPSVETIAAAVKEKVIDKVLPGRQHARPVLKA